MTARFITSLLVAAASLVSAAPAPAANEVTPRGQHEWHYPTVMIQLHESSPDHPFGDTDYGKVARENGRNTVSTLISIPIPHHVDGHKCQFYFTDPYNRGGSEQAQVFTIIGHIPWDATFNKRPSRDRHVATFKLANQWTGGVAEFEHFGGSTFTCPGGQTLHYELVPVNDNDNIEWDSYHGFAIQSSAW